MRYILLALAIKYNGDWNKIYNAITQKERFNQDYLDNLKNTYKEEFISILDDKYPEILKKTTNPPFVLFYKGNIDLINHNKIYAIVGSRNCSNYGKIMAKEIATGLGDAGACIISGLANGIDSISHQQCINNNYPTIAVVANGLDQCYPVSNKQLFEDIVNYGGLILTEFPAGTKASKDKFGNRNRIIASLSKGVVVAEAYERSGTLLTVKHALFNGIDVFCVPDRANVGSACNKLIKEGAKLVESAEDILEEIL